MMKLKYLSLQNLLLKELSHNGLSTQATKLRKVAALLSLKLIKSMQKSLQKIQVLYRSYQANLGDTVEVGATIAILDANGAPVAVSTPAPAEQPKQETAEAPKAAAPSTEQTATLQGLPNTNRPIASPAARKMARELEST